VPGYAKYVRFECWGEGETFAWTQPFFIEEPEAKKPAIGPKKKKPFIPEWQVSELVRGVTIDDAELESPADKKRPWSPVKSLTSGIQWGFTDVRGQIHERGGVVYLTAKIKSPSKQRGRIYLGYDGPIKVWLNDQQIFEGPGTNPAIPDKLALYGDFKRGENRLTIALDSNQGRAWGVFGRVELE
jgi:hypothetical protein